MSTDDPMGTRGGTNTSSGLQPEAEQKIRKDIDTVTETARQDFDALRTEAGERVGELRHEAERQIGKATDRARGFAGKQKDYAADQVGSVASALSKVADELEGNENAAVAGYARTLSRSLDRVSGTLRENDVDDVVGKTEDFGRREPAAFLGVAALAGFAASRFLTASAHRRSTARSATGTTTGNGTPVTGSATAGSVGGSSYRAPGNTSGSGRIS